MTPAGSLLAFTAAAALLTVTPGLDTALVLRTAVSESRRRALAAAAGICVGCLAWALLVAAGVAALLAASELAYAVLRLVGAAWLVWMGVRLLWRGSNAPATSHPAVTTRSTPSGSAFLRGVLTNLLNPKVGVFYVTFLPPFVPAGHAPGPWMVGLGAIHATLGIAWFTAIVQAAQAARAALARPPVMRWIDRVTAVALIGFGLRLATAPRA